MLSEVFAVSPEWSAYFLLVLARLTAAIVAAPLFGARSVPIHTRVGLAIVLSLIVLPLSERDLEGAPTDLFAFASALGTEVILGIALGVGIMLVFQGLEMAASLVSVQMGFGIGQVFDPISGQMSGTLEQFYKVLITLVFFAINGHYLVVMGFLATFEVVPPGQATLAVIAGDQVVPFFGTLIVSAIQIALPVFGALVLTDLALALVNRTVPQMNALVVGFPVKIGVGLIVLGASMPMLVSFLGATMGRALVDVNSLVVR
ncbi:MAG: flagellar biosynthetic protein FliR [Dehalococcoidia bacterium]|nr:flagellar biosynthetic protein FliR [Dehalococcoidia bacterium]MCA9857451.1 flagellar biosynthetic protein FliR [Dehalococcoidia bacterium]MCB9492043.1 flagellar biosynthetic protein FliR [Dehalococcoidia bacterium]